MTKTQRSNRLSGNAARRGRATPKQRDRRIVWIAAGVGAVLVLVLVVVLARRGQPGSIAGIQTFSAAQGHSTAPVTYPQTPPVGGVHNPAWQNCGVYSQPVQNENAVHALEHGAVWITYQPDLSSEQVQQLRDTAQNRSYVLLSPYAGLPAPVVASAWGVQLQLDSASDSRLAQFIAQYVQGPQTPEPGASCSGGTSATME